MSQEFPEPDWKIFRQLHPLALERFCLAVMSELDRVVGDQSQHGREWFFEALELMKKRHRELADTFDDMRRSTALLQLAIICRRGLGHRSGAFRADTADAGAADGIVESWQGLMNLRLE